MTIISTRTGGRHAALPDASYGKALRAISCAARYGHMNKLIGLQRVHTLTGMLLADIDRLTLADEALAAQQFLLTSRRADA